MVALLRNTDMLSASSALLASAWGMYAVMEFEELQS
jgi:hypothetical protein